MSNSTLPEAFCCEQKHVRQQLTQSTKGKCQFYSFNLSVSGSLCKLNHILYFVDDEIFKMFGP